MRRRRYLWMAAGLAGGLAGCLGGGGGRPTEAGPRTVGAGADVDLPVPEGDLVRAAPRDAIPAIVDPVFGEDWAGVSLEARTEFGLMEITPRLRPGERVVGVERAGEARAYPLRLLGHHEVVNDDLGGPLLVTYCPLCRSAVTAVRRVAGEVTVFGVTGLLYRENLVMYDRATDSRWSQLLARAVRGERTGDRLELVPSTVTTLGNWREAHPDTVVLRPPPESGTVVERTTKRDYTVDPYAGYADSDQVGVGDGGLDDDRLHPKTVLVGVVNGGVARAYPAPALERAGVVHDAVGGLPVVATTAADGTPVAYIGEVGDRVVRFDPAGERHLRAAGSRWRRATGRAVDGPHEGARLVRANDTSPRFWFAWVEFHPETGVYSS